ARGSTSSSRRRGPRPATQTTSPSRPFTLHRRRATRPRPKSRTAPLPPSLPTTWPCWRRLRRWRP
ncbi:hypothetical protein EMIHUDRAFT_252985, partial [Emiliania huxleyi CCMP1516]|uniref:Uncharacterized protein n=2 Tax=Emiliania huxleyi TaxID=2903 RepID=A0A0D3KDR7_EMIH1